MARKREARKRDLKIVRDLSVGLSADLGCTAGGRLRALKTPSQHLGKVGDCREALS
jgi:hypothetical protein